jgi:hypothetical protein
MTADPPVIASTLERTKLFMAASLMFFQAPLVFDRKGWFGPLLFLGGFYLCVDVARTLSTRVSAAGVSQLTWRGRVQLRWDDITAVTRRQRTTVLTGSAARVVVPMESFYDTQAATDYLESHLPSGLRQS